MSRKVAIRHDPVLIQQSQRCQPTAERICTFLKVSLADMQGTNAQEKTRADRHLLIALLAKAGFSSTLVSIFLNRGHSIVPYACTHVKKTPSLSARYHAALDAGVLTTDYAATPQPLYSRPVIRADYGACAETAKIVCDFLNVTLDDVLSHSREYRIMDARHVLAGTLVKVGHSLSDTARYMGRDHTTIVHSLKRVDASDAMTMRVTELATWGKTLVGGIRYVLLSIEPAMRSATEAYLLTDVLYERPGRPDQALWRCTGMRRLAADPDVIEKVRKVFTSYERHGPLTTLDRHMRQWGRKAS